MALASRHKVGVVCTECPPRSTPNSCLTLRFLSCRKASSEPFRTHPSADGPRNLQGPKRTNFIITTLAQFCQATKCPSAISAPRDQEVPRSFVACWERAGGMPMQGYADGAAGGVRGAAEDGASSSSGHSSFSNPESNAWRTCSMMRLRSSRVRPAVGMGS